MKSVISLFIFFCFQLVAFGQVLNEVKEKREKYPTYFALQLRGLIPNKFSEQKLNTVFNDTLTSSIYQKNGFSFGGIIRKRYTKSLGVETGLNLSKRYYDLTVSVPDSGLAFNKDFSFTTFELPVNGLVFIQLTNKFFANAGLGVSAIYKPSSVGVLFKEGKNAFTLGGIAYRKFNFNINAQLGFEFASEKSGTFYLGGSAHIPLTPLFAYVAHYSYANSDFASAVVYDQRSPFFTVDLRFYFPTIRNKGNQPLKGPIE
ncbi:MAG: outer membrane beta-barrel protein [Crocinitomicaceae bacterium]